MPLPSILLLATLAQSVATPARVSPDAVAEILSQLPELSGVWTGRVCEGRIGFVGVQNRGETLACLVGEDAPRCVPVKDGNFYNPLADCSALQGDPPPSWLAPAAALPPGIDRPNSSQGNGERLSDVLIWKDHGFVWLALRGPEGWKVSDAPVARDSERISLDGPPVDARALTGGPATALRYDRYDGGSGMGETWTALMVFDTSGARLHLRASMDVGWSGWNRVILGEARQPNVGQAMVLDGPIRPDGTLSLQVVDAHETAAALETGDETDPRPAIQGRAGVWRLDGCAFVRPQGPPPTGPCEAEVARAQLLDAWQRRLMP